MIKNQKPIFYYPYCVEKDCDGILKIKINDNYTIDYECEKNKNHLRNKISFNNFEKYFLKEEKVSLCSKCNSNLENDYHFICRECESLLCSNCFIFDEHIKKDINNLIVEDKKCLKHKKEINHYCINCKKYLCYNCIKFDKINNIHKNHKIRNLFELTPSNNNINDLINKINNNSKHYDDVINSINTWQEKINLKVNELKQNLRKGIEFCKNLI